MSVYIRPWKESICTAYMSLKGQTTGTKFPTSFFPAIDGWHPVWWSAAHCAWRGHKDPHVEFYRFTHCIERETRVVKWWKIQFRALTIPTEDDPWLMRSFPAVNSYECAVPPETAAGLISLTWQVKSKLFCCRYCINSSLFYVHISTQFQRLCHSVVFYGLCYGHVHTTLPIYISRLKTLCLFFWLSPIWQPSNSRFISHQEAVCTTFFRCIDYLDIHFLRYLSRKQSVSVRNFPRDEKLLKLQETRNLGEEMLAMNWFLIKGDQRQYNTKVVQKLWDLNLSWKAVISILNQPSEL